MPRVTDLLSKTVFGALVGLIVIAAIPYGTVEPWWKAAFVCAVFAICIVAIIESLASGANRIAGAAVLLPMLALSVLAFAQTLSLGSPEQLAGVPIWSTISADPFQTRFFALQMLALTACLALLYRYAATERRIRILIYTVLAVAVGSAVFGILRQSTQQQTGFLLPLLKQNQGYGQFINKNHFAFLMEMAFGLGLGIVLAGVNRDRLMVYVALLFPIWTALVLANSRGGILAMLAQVLVAALLVSLGKDEKLPSIMQSVALRAVLLVALVLGVLIGALWVGGDRLASNFEAASSEFSATQSPSREGASRNEIWRASLSMFAAHPILGVGLGGYWVGITAYHKAPGTMTPQEAHNDYLELLSSGGIVGFAIGVWFAVMVILRAGRNLFADSGFKRAVRFGAILGITGVAAHSLVDFGLHIMVNALIFVVLLMMATSRIDLSATR
jgi:O-antigen ligase